MIAEFRLPIRTRGPKPADTYALVDGTETWALHRKWHMCGAYPATTVDGRTVKLHRLVIRDVPEGMVVDHINRDPLDNRRQNLRIVTQSENMRNAERATVGRGSSQYRGVSKNGWKSKPWRATACVHGKTYQLGCHALEEEAAAAVAEFWESHPAAVAAAA